MLRAYESPNPALGRFHQYLGAQKFKNVFENVFEIAVEAPSKGEVLCC
jgi:hypothetical protein